MQRCYICLCENNYNIIDYFKNLYFNFTDNNCYHLHSLYIYDRNPYYNPNCYKLNCKCNVTIHKHCLNDWLVHKLVCPICLTPVKKYRNYSHNIAIFMVCSYRIFFYFLIPFNILIMMYIYYHIKKHFI